MKRSKTTGARSREQEEGSRRAQERAPRFERLSTRGDLFPGEVFSGEFQVWFTDGQRFLVNDGGTVSIYSKDATDKLPTTIAVPQGQLGGAADYVRVFAMTSAPKLDIFATADGPPSDVVSTILYKDGTAVTSVPGYPVAWLDDDHLLTQVYSMQATFLAVYAGSRVYDAAGALLFSPPLPEIKRVSVVSPDEVYLPDQNAILDVKTGAALWQGPLPPPFGRAPGAVAGNTVMYLEGQRLVLSPRRQ